MKLRIERSVNGIENNSPWFIGRLYDDGGGFLEKFEAGDIALVIRASVRTLETADSDSMSIETVNFK